LYKHQADALNAIQEGKNVLIITGTSSGKSLCYQLPVLNEILQHNSSTALFLFPTNALAEDQLKSLHNISDSLNNEGNKKLIAATYDGDTSQRRRTTIRNTSNIILSNPDMLHIGILPQHTRWERFLINLKFIVIDEVHTYRGIFGSHFANVLRRLKRLLNFYGSHPQMVLTSATLSNAQEFSEKLIGERFQIINEDFSFHEGRKYYFINPPLIDKSLGLRKSMTEQTLEITSMLMTAKIQLIIFSRTRKTVEITLRKLRERFERSAENFHGYRSGYLPNERRIIEEGLRSGKVRTVVSTNALEMGIDMGKVDATILMGYPGSISSFYQQTGRAGRRNRQGISVLVASPSPIDQYIIQHCDYLSKGSPENALIDPNNPLILLEHLRCASFELPMSDKEYFGDLEKDDLTVLLDALVQLNQLTKKGGYYYWISSDYPAANISLRNISGNPIALRLQDKENSYLIGEVDYQSALKMVHPGAVYFHDGIPYVIKHLDLDEHIAWLTPHRENYYTEPILERKIFIQQILSEEKKVNWKKTFGEILVEEQIKGYKRIDWESSYTLGVYDLKGLPKNTLYTKGVWITLDQQLVNALREKNAWRNDQNDYGKDWSKIRLSVIARDKNRCQVCGLHLNATQLHVHHKKPFKSFDDSTQANQEANLITLCSNCHKKVEQNVRMRSGLSGTAYLVANLAPLYLLCDQQDIGFFSDTAFDSGEKSPVIMIYDQFPGGIGLSAKLYAILEGVLEKSIELIRMCQCDEGCPSCVGPAGENGVGGKDFAYALIERLLSE